MARGVAGWIERAWHPASPGARLAQTVLQPAAFVYGLVTAWRNRRYDRGGFPVERVPARWQFRPVAVPRGLRPARLLRD